MNLPQKYTATWAAVAAFCTYMCFYPFRRAYTAASFEELYFWGVHFKILIITAQVLGFAVSKGIGVKVVSEMKPENRARNLLIFCAISWVCMLGFGQTPAPYNLIFVFMASLPLGLIYGMVLGFLEGRQITDLLVAVLTASFIIGSGFAKSVGKYLMNDWHISEFMMPFWADSLMFIPLAASVFMLSKTPPPSIIDQENRAIRQPMTAQDRKQLMQKYGFGLVLFIVSYVLATAYREFRDNFTPEILKELGQASSASIFTKTEVPIAVAVLLIMAGFRWVKNNSAAFKYIQLLMIAGAILIAASTLAYQFEWIGPITWLILAGAGVYLGYSMSNSLYSERMMASFQEKGTIGFLITLADFYAYFGSIVVLFYKNYFQSGISQVQFFIGLSYGVSILYLIVMLLSFNYFGSKTHEQNR